MITAEIILTLNLLKLYRDRLPLFSVFRPNFWLPAQDQIQKFYTTRLLFGPQEIDLLGYKIMQNQDIWKIYKKVFLYPS